MTNNITNRQLFYILLLTVTCYSVVVLPKEIVEASGTGAWLPILVMTFIFAVSVSGIVLLNNKFQGKSLFEYAPNLVTKPGAYLIVIFYILFYLLILVFLVCEQAKLIKADFLPKTPLWATQLLGVFVFCIIAYKGITNVARMAEIFGIIFIITAVTVHAIMTIEGDITRILPLFDPHEIGSYINGIKPSYFAFIPPSILLAITFTKKNGKKSIKIAFLSMIIIGLFYIFIVESCIMKLGLSDIVNYKDALIVAIRDTAPQSLKNFARLDVLFLTVGFSGLFLGVSIILSVLVDYICRIFARTRRLTVVISLGVVIYGLFFMASGIKGFYSFVTEVGTYLGGISSIVIPVMLLIIAKIKKAGIKVKDNA